MTVLPDLLAKNLDVVFCGTAAGRKSAEMGAYYAGPGNRFWPTLHEVGLTPRRLAPAEYPQLLTYRLGLTDLAKFASGADSGLRRADFNALALRETIARYRPKVLAFTSKRAALEFFGGDVDYGRNRDRIGETLLFTLTSPSGLATRFWQGGKHWHDLAALVRTFGTRSR
jgi:double-stranded uracil-DNA glycosylase